MTQTVEHKVPKKYLLKKEEEKINMPQVLWENSGGSGVLEPACSGS